MKDYRLNLLGMIIQKKLGLIKKESNSEKIARKTVLDIDKQTQQDEETIKKEFDKFI